MRRFSEGLERELRLGRINKTPREWATYCLWAGAVPFAFAAALGHHSLAPFLGLGCAYAACKYPWYRGKRIAGEVERELPLALRSAATFISMGMPFEECLRRCCENSELSRQLGIALKEAELGKPIPEALGSISERVDSDALKKAVEQLEGIYERRGEPFALRKLGEELVSLQKSQLQEYSGKLVVYSLVFIAFSAILPALFQAYVIVGSTFMSQMITPEEAFWIPAAVFPAVNAGVLVFIRLKKPFFA